MTMKVRRTALVTFVFLAAMFAQALAQSRTPTFLPGTPTPSAPIDNRRIKVTEVISEILVANCPMAGAIWQEAYPDDPICPPLSDDAQTPAAREAPEIQVNLGEAKHRWLWPVERVDSANAQKQAKPKPATPANGLLIEGEIAWSAASIRPTSDITFRIVSAKTVVEIHNDGRVTWTEGTLPEAAVEFWKGVAKLTPTFQPTERIQAIEALELALTHLPLSDQGCCEIEWVHPIYLTPDTPVQALRKKADAIEKRDADIRAITEALDRLKKPKEKL